MRAAITAIALLICAAASCDRRAIIGEPPPSWGPMVTLGAMPSAYANFFGEVFTFSATWVGGTAPYSVSWNFGANFTPTTASTAGTSDSQTVLLNNVAGSTGTVSVTVTDAQNLPGSATGDYSFGPGPADPPMLTIAGGDGTASITVQADDIEGDDVTITPSVGAGFTAPAAQTVDAGASATFDFYAEDIFAGGNAIATFNGIDANGDAAGSVTAMVTAPPIVLAADTLYAIPLKERAAVGEEVTIVIASGVPANPFTYCNGVRVTGPTGFAYVPNSFNAGNPGGLIGDNDGTWWSAMSFSGFLLAPDDLWPISTDLGGGRIGWDFHLVPIGAQDNAVNPSGAIFNFEATFAPGLNTLGFQDSSGAVPRTYYADINETEYYWGDISNNHAGVPNSVFVE